MLSFDVSLSLANFQIWLLLLTSLYYWVKYTSGDDCVEALKLTALVTVSYSLTIFVHPILAKLNMLSVMYGGIFYLIYLLMDLVTLALVIRFSRKLVSRADKVSNAYVILVLVVNSALYSLLLFELYYYFYLKDQGYRDWVVILYQYGINVMDMMLVVALLTRKDFLGFYAIIKERRWPLVKTDTPHSS